MNIYILGINHQIQAAEIGSHSTDGTLENFERDQKQQFDVLLQKIMDERNIEFLGEEASHRWNSVAQAVSKAKKCRYANIEIPPEERAARKIPTDYESNESLTQNEKTQFHEEREDYMYEKTITEAGSAKSILVICERFHTTRLAAKFRAAGHAVEEADIQKESWYVEDWITHMMKL